MLLGKSYLSKHGNSFAAFNRLQIALMERFIARGGTVERWMERLAPAFRKRYSWLCEEIVPIPVTTREHEIRRFADEARRRRR